MTKKKKGNKMYKTTENKKVTEEKKEVTEKINPEIIEGDQEEKTNEIELEEKPEEINKEEKNEQKSETPEEEKNVQQVPKTLPYQSAHSLYYQEKGLLIDNLLSENNIEVESAEFYAQGKDFVTGYNELKEFVENNEYEDLILATDTALFDLLQKRMNESENEQAPVDDLGNIPDIIRNISKEDKVLLSEARIMVKNAGKVQFFAIGRSGIPIMVNKKPKKFNIDQLKGTSNIITNENFKKAFSSIKTTQTAVFYLSLKQDKKLGEDQVIVNLSINGQIDIKFGNKNFQKWLTN